MTFLKHDEQSKEFSQSFPNVKLSTDAKRWGFWKKFIYTFIWIALPRSIYALFHVEVNGIENLRKVPEGMPLLLCGNHKSNLDSIIVGTTAAHPKFRIRRFVAFMVYGRAFQANFLTRKLELFGGFPVFKDNPEKGLRYTIESLKANLTVTIFPQGGKISHASVLSDYRNIPNEGKTGVGRIILRLNGQVPVVPFYIHGSEKALKVGSFLPKWGSKISITFGEPMYFTDYKRQIGWDTNSDDFFKASRVIVDKIMNNVWHLLKNVESAFLEMLEKELGIPLDNIDENLYSAKINSILNKMKNLKNIYR